MSIKNERYFRIKNWEKYQHRDHKKTMRWFKAYPSILNDPEFMELKEGQRLAWLLLLHYCCTTENKLPHSVRFLRSRFNLKRYPDLALFERLGWIETFSDFGECAESAPKPRLDLDKSRKEKNPPTPLQKLNNHCGENKENQEFKKAAEKPPFKVEKIMQIWNEKGLPQLKGFFPKRTEVVTEFWGERPDLEYWAEVFSRVRRSDFLMGEGKNKPWRTTLEWVMHRHIEIMEGKYDNEKSQYAVPLRHSPRDDSNRT